jgi:hypothetical protein
MVNQLQEIVVLFNPCQLLYTLQASKLIESGKFVRCYDQCRAKVGVPAGLALFMDGIISLRRFRSETCPTVQVC